MYYNLIKTQKEQSLIAWDKDKKITYSEFINDVFNVANALPQKQYAVNLCENRYLFMVAFAATMIKKQTNLLPHDRLYETLYTVASDYSECYCISDSLLSDLDLQQVNISENINLTNNNTKIDKSEIEIDAEHIAAIVFTSGSTGKPKPNKKKWGSLVIGAQRTAKRFELNDSKLQIVSTVPPQHMFGLETSIMLCLQCALPINVGRPFYPEDVRQVIDRVGSNIMLVTTPFHLRACICAKNMQWKGIKFILSATAPLSVELAKKAESRMQTKVKEIYGCTELGAIASRETARDEPWHLYSDFELCVNSNQAYIKFDNENSQLALNDKIKIYDPMHFELQGRNEDLVNIAGKRGSLADIKLKIISIEGVDDAVIYQPDSNDEISRLTAFVVSKKQTATQIAMAMSKKVDRIFIPRPIFIVNNLPYNETGKITRDSLSQLFEICKKRNDRLKR